MHAPTYLLSFWRRHTNLPSSPTHFIRGNPKTQRKKKILATICRFHKYETTSQPTDHHCRIFVSHIFLRYIHKKSVVRRLSVGCQPFELNWTKLKYGKIKWTVVWWFVDISRREWEKRREIFPPKSLIRANSNTTLSIIFNNEISLLSVSVSVFPQVSATVHTHILFDKFRHKAKSTY